MRLLVCGGRDFNDQAFLDTKLSEVAPSIICHGGAQGADRLAGEWARRFNIPCAVYPAKWKEHGRAAGMLRNQTMLTDFKPDAVMAFPGGKGTANMIELAVKARIRVYLPAGPRPATGEQGEE